MELNVRKSGLRLILIVLLGGVLLAACSGGTQMYKHQKSDCNCSTF
ncbi:MAG: hypothetical protein IJU19_06300 [Bacteroidales bacterium]|nr:hypothetical protein [Bacteroidales bacterium]